jgi:hypothetical protein
VILATYSDPVFGLFWLLGYQFSPRLADFGDARFWRMDPKADFRALNGVALQRINIPRIPRNWDDLLRVPGTLKEGHAFQNAVVTLCRAFILDGEKSLGRGGKSDVIENQAALSATRRHHRAAARA